MTERIRGLLNASRSVIADCALGNGAIVAANTASPAYHAEAKCYFYVWPRDASFVCLAARALGLHEVYENFFRWCAERAEGWGETGLFYEKYHVNGLQARERFQPDQTGMLLTAAVRCCEGEKRRLEGVRELVRRSADGLCAVWGGKGFRVPVNDVWEERIAYPDLEENFTYSLAACARGLRLAGRAFSEERHQNAAREMEELVLRRGCGRGYLARSFGRLDDERIDASALGALWPFETVPIDGELARGTVREIEDRLVIDLGLHRYEHDEYDGWIYRGKSRNKGAGWWPLLNLWMAIVLARMGRRDRALDYYMKVIESCDSAIPEQMFPNPIQRSVAPLCWSHAMFVLASDELGFLTPP